MSQLAKIKQTSNEVARVVDVEPVSKELIANIILNNDLKKLTPEQKLDYYYAFCSRLKMDPATRPFQLLEIKGKQTLYCDRSGAAQLNKLYNITHECVETKEFRDCYMVIMKASDAKHSTVSVGVVSLKGLSGEDLANAIMKAETKAKRRSTLDLMGLGVLDISEIESIKDAKKVDVETGNVIDGEVIDDKKPTTKTTKPAENSSKELTAEDFNAYKTAIESAPSFDDLKSVFKEAWRTFEGDTDAQDDFKTVYENRKAILTAVAPGAPAGQKLPTAQTTSSLRELRNREAA